MWINDIFSSTKTNGIKADVVKSVLEHIEDGDRPYFDMIQIGNNAKFLREILEDCVAGMGGGLDYNISPACKSILLTYLNKIEERAEAYIQYEDNKGA